MTGPNEILKKYWNYDSFNDLQEEIIQEVLSNHDCIALLPTGGGKSICYQVPALIKQGICLVVSPLIALINDQVNDLNNRGIKAIALTSQLNFSETITAFDNLKFGNYKFLYLSPEKLQNEIIQEKIKELNISLIAIDEAHCISEWGHDFRPSYLKLKILKLLAPNAPILALTATATKTVLNDIKNQLELDFVKIFKKSFKRKSLQYEVQFIEDLNRKLLFLIKQNNQNPAIIYVSSRRNTKEISEFLTKNGIKNSYYHGGLKFEEKAIAYENWMTEKTPIIIATTAFGMGINKKNVRLIIHLSIPFSLENYIQESGRAARDGNLAKAIILTNESQIELAKQSFYLNTPDKKFVKLIYQNLNRFYKISKGELPLGTFKFSIQEFCATYQLPIIKTFNAIQLLVNENIISLNANFKSLSTIKFLVSPQALNNYIIQKPSKGLLIKTLLRSYGGIFDFETKINENTLSEKLNNTKKEIIQNLNELATNQIINYNQSNQQSSLNFLVPREENFVLASISKHLSQQYKLKANKLQSVLDYLYNNTICRTKFLLNYFDERTTNCNQCDICKSEKNITSSRNQIDKDIIKLLKTKDLSSAEITETLNYKKNEILNSLEKLLFTHKIAINSQNKFKLFTK